MHLQNNIPTIGKIYPKWNPLKRRDYCEILRCVIDRNEQTILEAELQRSRYSEAWRKLHIGVFRNSPTKSFPCYSISTPNPLQYPLMNTSEFDYHLPPHLIAQIPLKNRSESRLLVLDRSTNQRHHTHFSHILSFLTSNDVLVFNDTQVIKARIHTQKHSGAMIEILLLNPTSTDMQWTCLIKNARRLSIGDTLQLSQNTSIQLILKTPDSPIHIIQFQSPHPIWDILDHHGEIPLPPYITHPIPDAEERYQTVFAKHKGAVAAPTAGLHFTQDLLDQIKKTGIQTETITLHVGYGTFKPIETNSILDHPMHHESVHITEPTAKRLIQAKQAKKRIIAVGTTVVRTLESSMNNGQLQSGTQSTNLFIYPGYTFQMVDALITNFHLPKSTLICMVSALAGLKPIQEAYKDAIKHNYRFYSFGDAMLIL